LLTEAGGGFAPNGYYSNGSTVYYVEGNGNINTTSVCTAPPPPPPPPPAVDYYDYVRCTGPTAYASPIFSVAITGTPPVSLTIAGECFAAYDGIAYPTPNYPTRTYTATGCGCS
jgi:hypothetical protein